MDLDFLKLEMLFSLICLTTYIETLSIFSPLIAPQTRPNLLGEIVLVPVAVV